MRSQALTPKLIALSISMAVLLGCTPHKMASDTDEAPLRAKLVDSSERSIERAAMAYLSGLTSPWVSSVTQDKAKPVPIIKAKPQPPPFHVKSNALATTLQNELEVDPQVASKIAPLIERSAQKYDVPPYLIAAVVNRETEFDGKKRSSAGAVGLAQIMPNVWGKECKGNLRHDAVNIDCSAMILAHYHDLTGDWEQALAFYNVGPGKYERSPKARTVGHRYASNVLSDMGKIKKGRALELASIQRQL